MPDMPDMPDSPGLSRRSVVRGAAWTVPVVAVAATAPAFAASVNISLLQTGCDTSADNAGDCRLLTRQADLTWQIVTTLTIPVGTVFQMTASRPLYCRRNRVEGTLRTGGYVGVRSVPPPNHASTGSPEARVISKYRTLR